MNTHRVSHIPIIVLSIVALILFAAGGITIFITIVWPLNHASSGQAPRQADPQEVVENFHDAINSNSPNDVLALFADNSTITENQTLIDGQHQIRNWLISSKRMAGLHLKMFHAEMDGEKLIWLDIAHNELEGQERYYILRWEAVMAEGKIQSLVVMPRYMPDSK